MGLWWVDLRRCPAGEKEQALLDTAERSRLGGISDHRARRRFVAARAALRRLLAAALDCEPAGIVLATSCHGKPHLARPASALHFNLAHSGEIALVALSPLGEVGVDLELRQPRRESRRIARRFFSEEEARVVEEKGGVAFLRLWVRKEAVLKAHGRGIALGLRRAGGLPLEETEIRVELETANGANRDWAVRELDGVAGVTMAVAHAGDRVPELRLHRLQP